jgi:hypothetical protein
VTEDHQSRQSEPVDQFFGSGGRDGREPSGID